MGFLENLRGRLRGGESPEQVLHGREYEIWQSGQNLEARGVEWWTINQLRRQIKNDQRSVAGRTITQDAEWQEELHHAKDRMLRGGHLERWRPDNITFYHTVSPNKRKR